MAFIGLTRGKMKVGAVFEIHLKSGTPDSQAREEIPGKGEEDEGPGSTAGNALNVT